MSDRVFAIALLVICGVIGWQMWHLHVPFAYEPVGPKAFPLLLAAMMTLCCIFILIKPDTDINWPERSLLIRNVLFVLTLLIYAWAFELLGFMLATTLMVIAVSQLFGASWKAGVITGALVGVTGYLLFDRLLEVSLPIGRLWS